MALSEREVLWFEGGRRLRVTLQALAMTQTEWTLMGEVLRSSSPIPTATLAEITWIPKTTVRKYIQSAIDMGVLERIQGKGVQPVSSIRPSVEAIVTEVIELMEGHRDRFSKAIIESVVALQADTHKDAKADVEALSNLTFNILVK